MAGKNRRCTSSAPQIAPCSADELAKVAKRPSLINTLSNEKENAATTMKSKTELGESNWVLNLINEIKVMESLIAGYEAVFVFLFKVVNEKVAETKAKVAGHVASGERVKESGNVEIARLRASVSAGEEQIKRNEAKMAEMAAEIGALLEIIKEQRARIAAGGDAMAILAEAIEKRDAIIQIGGQPPE